MYLIEYLFDLEVENAFLSKISKGGKTHKALILKLNKMRCSFSLSR